MARWSPFKLAWIGAAVALVIGGYMLVNRGLRQHDIIVASPSPPGVFVDGRLPLEPGDRACVGPIRFSPASGRIRLVVETRATPVPQLIVDPVTPVESAAIVVDDYPSGKVTQILVPFKIPEATSGRVCVKNSSRRGTVSLASTDEARYLSLSKTTVNGKPSTMQASLQLLAPKRSTIVERLPVAVRQDAQLTGVLPRWIVWLLLFGVPIAIIAGPLYVMTDVLRRDDENSG